MTYTYAEINCLKLVLGATETTGVPQINATLFAERITLEILYSQIHIHMFLKEKSSNSRELVPEQQLRGVCLLVWSLLPHFGKFKFGQCRATPHLHIFVMPSRTFSVQNLGLGKIMRWGALIIITQSSSAKWTLTFAVALYGKHLKLD